MTGKLFLKHIFVAAVAMCIILMPLRVLACPQNLEPIPLSSEGLFLGKNYSTCWFHESAQELKLAEALQHPWHLSEPGAILPVVRNQGVWRAIRVRNVSGLAREWVVFSELAVTSESVSFFILRENSPGMLEIHSGAGIAIGRRQTASRMHAATFSLAPNEVATIYARSQSSFTSNPGYRIHTRENFVLRDSLTVVGFGLVIGLTFAYCLLALTTTLFLRARLFFYCALFCFGSLGQALVSSGVISLAFWHWDNLFPGRFAPLSTGLMLLSANLLAREFLKVSLYKIWNAVSRVLVFLSLSIMMLGFFSSTLSVAWILAQGASVLSLALFSIVATQQWKRLDVRIFLLSWWIYGASLTLWVGATRGVIEASFFTFYAMFFAIFLQVIFLSAIVLNRARVMDQERIQAKAEASQNQRTQTLMRILSHDINNMITGIQLNAEFVEESEVFDDSVRHSTAVILKHCDNMAELVGSVRTLNALDDGKLALNLAPVALTELREALLLSFEKQASAVNVGLNFEGFADSHIQVLAERGALVHSILGNFVSNAIKFSPTGESVVLSFSEHDDVVSITVADSGMGIPQDLLKVLFDPTKPTTRRGVRGEKGTGYGMCVAKAMIEKMGGTIVVESQCDTASLKRGTQVTITLRRANDASISNARQL